MEKSIDTTSYRSKLKTNDITIDQNESAVAPSIIAADASIILNKELYDGNNNNKNSDNNDDENDITNNNIFNTKSTGGTLWSSLLSSLK